MNFSAESETRERESNDKNKHKEQENKIEGGKVGELLTRSIHDVIDYNSYIVDVI